MNQVTTTIKTLIATHGTEILNQPQRLKAMLTDLLPHEKRKLYLVNLSLQADIPKKMLAIQNETSADWIVKLNAHKHYFKEEFFLEDKPIKMIFDCWAEVLPRKEAKSTRISEMQIHKADKPVHILYKRLTLKLNNESVLIPAGTFMMGSPESEVDRRDDEIQHQVTLSAFRMCKYQITNAQYADFLNKKGIGYNGKFAAGTYPNELLISESSVKRDWGLHYINNQWVSVPGCENNPVINVTWYGAAEFARYVGGSLPTEAQWEYACRAGTTTPFNTGYNLTTDQANYNGNYPYNNNAKGQYREKTLPVGSFLPNGWGLYDMHGNVWEWCNDWSGNYTTASQTNPTGPASGSYRVIRGGSWGHDAQYCRSAYRSGSYPSDYSNNIGFRVVFVP